MLKSLFNLFTAGYSVLQFNGVSIKEIESLEGSENLRILAREARQVYKLKRKIKKNRFNIDYTKDVKKVAIAFQCELSK